MTITFWILYSLLTINIALHIVGFCKKIGILTKLAANLFVPLIAVTNILHLITRLPNSYHTLIISILAFTSVIVCQLIFNFTKSKFSSFLYKGLFLFSSLCWIHLFISAFYIYRVSTVLSVIFLVLWGFLCTFTLIFGIKQNFFEHLYTFILLFVVVLLNLCGFSFLLYGKSLSGVILTLGTLLLLALMVICYINPKKINIDKETNLNKFLHLRLIFFVLSQILISYANVITLF